MTDLPILDETEPAAAPTSTHYEIAGKLYPRVSHVLGVGIPDPAAKFYTANPGPALEGTALHHLAAWWLTNREHVADVDAWLEKIPEHRRPWLKMFVGWAARRVAKVHAVEKTVMADDEDLYSRFAGTVDLVAELDDGHRWIVDYKTGKESARHYWQAAAYAKAWNSQFPNLATKRRLICYLKADASRHQDVERPPAKWREDFETWRAALRVYTVIAK